MWQNRQNRAANKRWKRSKMLEIGYERIEEEIDNVRERKKKDGREHKRCK